MTAIDRTPVLEPEELGVDRAGIQALVERARREVEAGLLPSCQLAIARYGQLAAFVTLGEADNDTRYVVFSCTKALTGSMAWKLIGEGALSRSTRAAELIPEFGTNGKDGVTLEHLLTHTAGFPNAPLGAPDWATVDGRLDRFARWRLEWEPGSKYTYHPTSAHWVVAHMVQAVTGQDYRQYFAEHIAGPLGLPGLQIGAAVGDQDGIATLEIRGEPATPDELEAVLGIRELPITEVTDEALVGFNDPATRAVGVPGGGGITTAADLALFYQALLHNPDQHWQPEALGDATAEILSDLPDPMLGIPSHRSLGLVIAGDDGRANLRGFGRTVSPGTFGHNGAAGQIAWADPATGLSFVYLTNGVDPHPIRVARRGVALSSLAAVCAGESEDRRVG